MEAYEIVLEVLVEFPVVVCTLFLAVKYTAVLGQELNKRRQATYLYLDPERVRIFTKMVQVNST